MTDKRFVRFQLLVASACAMIACGPEGSANGQERASAGAPQPAADPCRIVRASAPLPVEVRETSGLARSGDGAGFWTHNDAGGDPVLFRIDEGGRIAQTLELTGASLEDWEDIDSGPCDGGTCIYVGDIGDNDAERDHITVYRVREPAADATAVAPEVVHLRYPDGARDAESLFVDGSGTINIVTKGRDAEIALYRASPNAWNGGTFTLEPVRTLFPRPEDENDRVTAAAITPDGRWVAVRSYAALYLYPFAALTSGADVTPVAYDLAGLGQAQGEALVIADDGTVWITSEAERRGTMPTWMQLHCPLPATD